MIEWFEPRYRYQIVSTEAGWRIESQWKKWWWPFWRREPDVVEQSCAQAPNKTRQT